MMMMLTLVVKVKCSKFLEYEIVKLHGKIIIENCLFISKSINFDLPSIFNRLISTRHPVFFYGKKP